jgi:hypothetical protein
MWSLILLWKKLRGKASEPSRFWEYRGYRRALGGRWGRWEVNVMGPLLVWWPSPCEHYPAPPLATHTEPLETEEYDVSTHKH